MYLFTQLASSFFEVQQSAVQSALRMRRGSSSWSKNVETKVSKEKRFSWLQKKMRSNEFIADKYDCASPKNRADKKQNDTWSKTPLGSLHIRDHSQLTSVGHFDLIMNGPLRVSIQVREHHSQKTAFRIRTISTCSINFLKSTWEKFRNLFDNRAIARIEAEVT